jgi:type II secretory pathway component PulF
MPTFAYKAKRGLEEMMEGTLIAENHDDALNKLVAQGLFPVSIDEMASPKAPPKRQKLRQQLFGAGKKSASKISSAEILNFTQKLTTLMRAKVELLAALKILYEQTENARFQAVIQEIYNITKEGKPLSESFLNFPSVFSPLFVNIVKAGETGGRLDQALEQIGSFMTRQESLKTKVRVALAYPTMLLAIGLLSIFILMNFVVPKLKPIFAGMGKDLPLITKVILKISELSNKTWWAIIAVTGIVIFILYRKKGAAFFQGIARNVKMNLPILKRMTRNQDLAHVASSLTLLLKSGVPALKALQVSAPTVEEPKLKKDLEAACADIAAGQSLSKSMQTVGGLPNFFTKMVAVGEESGRLTEVLEEISSSYVQQIEADIALITSLLEPILILFLGSILGVIVLSILLPTFQMTQVVR